MKCKNQKIVMLMIGVMMVSVCTIEAAQKKIEPSAAVDTWRNRYERLTKDIDNEMLHTIILQYEAQSESNQKILRMMMIDFELFFPSDSAILDLLKNRPMLLQRVPAFHVLLEIKIMPLRGSFQKAIAQKKKESEQVAQKEMSEVSGKQEAESVPQKLSGSINSGFYKLVNAGEKVYWLEIPGKGFVLIKLKRDAGVPVIEEGVANFIYVNEIIDGKKIKYTELPRGLFHWKRDEGKLIARELPQDAAWIGKTKADYKGMDISNKNQAWQGRNKLPDPFGIEEMKIMFKKKS